MNKVIYWVNDCGSTINDLSGSYATSACTEPTTYNGANCIGKYLIAKKKMQKKTIFVFQMSFCSVFDKFCFPFFYWASCIAGYGGAEKTYICSSEGIWTAENGVIVCTSNFSCHYFLFFVLFLME